MATVIQIKRSSGTAKPSALAQGELAYSYGVGGSFGEQLFIGTGVETAGEAANIDVIGGKYFTDKLDHAIGTLTASSAILVDSNSAIDEFIIGNSATVGGTLKLNEGTNNGTNFIGLKAPNAVTTTTTFTLPDGDGSNGQFLKTDGSGNLSFGTVSSTITLAADSGSNDTYTTGNTLTFTGGTGIDTTVSDDTITIAVDATIATASSTTTFTNKTFDANGTGNSITNIEVADLASGVLDTDLSSVSASDDTLASAKAIKAYVDAQTSSIDVDIAGDTGTGAITDAETLTFTGGEGIDTSVSDNTVTISAEDASDTNKGIASFDATDFTVSSGDVTLNAERVQDIAGAMFSSNTETLITATYQDADGTIDLVVDNDLSNYDNSSSGFITASTTDTLTNKTINASQLVDGSVSSAKIAGDAIDGTKIADDAIDSEHITDGSVDNVHLSNSSITIGSDSVSLGATQTDLNGITSLDVDNITVDGNTISTTDANGDLILDPNGSGDVDVNSSKIINVATPTADNDAANKAYVDGVVNGLDVKDSVRYASTANVA